MLIFGICWAGENKDCLVWSISVSLKAQSGPDRLPSRERMLNTGSIHNTEAVLAADHAGQPERVAISVQPGVTLSVRSVLAVTKQTENLTAASLLPARSCFYSTRAAGNQNQITGLLYGYTEGQLVEKTQHNRCWTDLVNL